MSLLFLVLAVISSAYHFVASACAFFFRIRRKNFHAELRWPKTACLKPLCGLDFEMAENLRTFVEQDYPDYEVVFGTAKAQDPAQEIAQEVCHRSAPTRARTVFGEKGEGSNRKIRNVRNIESHVSQDAEILVLSDSDIRVTSDYLKTVVAPIQEDERVGAVTNLYRLENSKDLSGLMEAMFAECTFLPGVLVASTFSSLGYAFGASIAVRRQDFSKAGGFEAVENYLADDYRIGHLIARQGKKVVLSPYVVSIFMPKQSIGDTLRHLVRWNRTVRTCNPVGYFFSAITYNMIWGALAFAFLFPRAMAWHMLLLCCLARSCSAFFVSFAIGARHKALKSFLAPLWEVVSFSIWAAGFAKRKVLWRGVTYEVSPNGKMVEIK